MLLLLFQQTTKEWKAGEIVLLTRRTLVSIVVKIGESSSSHSEQTQSSLKFILLKIIDDSVSVEILEVFAVTWSPERATEIIQLGKYDEYITIKYNELWLFPYF